MQKIKKSNPLEKQSKREKERDPMEEEIEKGGVVNGLDLGSGPVVPGAISDGPLRLNCSS